MAREGKISVMKIGFGENKVIIRVPYDLYTHVQRGVYANGSHILFIGNIIRTVRI